MHVVACVVVHCVVVPCVLVYCVIVHCVVVHCIVVSRVTLCGRVLSYIVCSVTCYIILHCITLQARPNSACGLMLDGVPNTIRADVQDGVSPLTVGAAYPYCT